MPGEFTWLVILLGQFVTMALIGLWHGVTWNFAIWGAWHGMGLFVHNRWTAYRRGRGPTSNPGRYAIVQHALGILFTFHFVTLGWVWFALPNVDMSFQTLQKLLGL
jgi:alginate O-acetyltransferase complex protein AlgI